MRKRIQLSEAQLKRIVKKSVRRALMEEIGRQNTEAQARNIYDKIMAGCPNGYKDWDFEITEEGIDGPNTFEGNYHTEEEDENGGTWQFDVGCGGYCDENNVEVEDTSYVEFISPDGQHGIISDR